MHEPAIGERVLVRPHSNIRVQSHAYIPGRLMPNEWHERVWDDWLHVRFSAGEIMVKRVEAQAAKDEE
jgi:hypothetical protein